jgi:glyceraldehyde 3-phosphate dehydrogenase
MKKIAINGMGRIGRAAFKILFDHPDAEIVAINDLVAAENLAYLLKYDTVYGRYEKKVEAQEDNLIVEDRKIKLLKEKDPSQLPWKDLEIEVVFECTGKFTKKEDLEKHIHAGANMAILSAPSKSEEVVTRVFGVSKGDPGKQIISCASCTTNCITPVVEIMERRVGIHKAIMTTVHAYTSTQSLVDGPSSKFRRGRTAGLNLVPSTTGAAVATTKVLPALKGKFDGVAIRVPVPIGSISDIVFLTSRKVTVEELNSIFREEAGSDQYKGILGVTDEQLVSSDIIRDPRASIVDLTMTKVVDGDLVKVMSWYDNEWGYANQMVKEAMR